MTGHARTRARAQVLRARLCAGATPQHRDPFSRKSRVPRGVLRAALCDCARRSATVITPAAKHAEAHAQLNQEVLRSQEVIAALQLDKDRLKLEVIYLA